MGFAGPRRAEGSLPSRKVILRGLVKLVNTPSGQVKVVRQHTVLSLAGISVHCHFALVEIRGCGIP